MQRARSMLQQLKADVPADAKIPRSTQFLVVGDYVGPEDRLRISMRGGSLLAEYSTGAVGCEMRPLAIDRYYCMDKDVELIFERDGRRAITRVHEQHPDYRIIRRKAL
jgi:hypothetical protein